MSAIFQGLLAANGRIFGGAGNPTSYFRGLQFGVDGGITNTPVAGIHHYIAGIPCAEPGNICIGAGPVVQVIPGGAGLNAAGRLVVDNAGAIAIYHQGVPFTAAGALCVTGFAAVGFGLTDLDGDAKPDTLLLDTTPGGPDVTIDADSINVDIDGDGQADVVIPR